MSYERPGESECEAKHLAKGDIGLVGGWGDDEIAKQQIEGEQAAERTHHSEKDRLHKLAAAPHPPGSSHTLRRGRAGQGGMHAIDHRPTYQENGRPHRQVHQVLLLQGSHTRGALNAQERKGRRPVGKAQVQEADQASERAWFYSVLLEGFSTAAI